ncbi:hypothetical protein ENBRE01_2443 [Enteropsectra breve]|nr:hypothetical protein ENBRE01_2443 [Enteropsectra breve]
MLTAGGSPSHPRSISKDRYCSLARHKIDTGKSRLFVQKQHSLPYNWEEEAKTTVQNWAEQGINRPSSGERCSSLVAVKKKDGRLRLCVDYRALNEETVKDKYPLPNIENILDSLAIAEYFTASDATAGYHQFEINEDDK